MTIIGINVENGEKIYNLSKGQIKVLFELLKYTTLDNEGNCLIRLDILIKEQMIKNIGIIPGTLNNMLSQLVKADILTRKHNNIFVLNKDIFVLI